MLSPHLSVPTTPEAITVTVPSRQMGETEARQAKGNITPPGHVALSTPKWKSKDSNSCIPASNPTCFPKASVPHALLLALAAGHEQAASRPGRAGVAVLIRSLVPPTAWLPEPVPQQPPAAGAGSEAVTGHPHHQVRPQHHLGTPALCTTWHRALGEFSAPDFVQCGRVLIPESGKSLYPSAIAV